MSNFKSSTARILRRLGAVAMVSALFAGGTVLTAPAAQAAPLSQHVFTFSQPKGEDWVVPYGVTEVLVGLRGGDGGYINTSSPGGRGQTYLLQLDVTPGDTLTLYAGKSGEGFGRAAGLGFIDGGKGGDKSRSGTVGNGGGGASALKLNGELLAVAGGGGGAGGDGGDRDFRLDVYDFDRGGTGGDAVSGEQPGWGQGKHAGNPGKNGVDDPAFARYGKAGEDGKSAGFLTSGGGGGAGGGGWPASGTAGGAGKKRLGFGAGSGGGAGMSWVADVPQLTVLEQGTRPYYDWTGRGPMAGEGAVKVTIPLQADTELYGPTEVAPGEAFDLRAVGRDLGLGQTPVDGTYTLERDGTVIASGDTDGDITIPIEGLSEGEHTFAFNFTAKHRMGVYWEERAQARSELTVVVTPAPSGVSERGHDHLPYDKQNDDDGVADAKGADSKGADKRKADADEADAEAPLEDSIERP
ncbi:hypothetical protein GCM10009688_25860 [Arthrobacter gandavensis]|uniref:Glycine rich protein n=1 Tax=Arthrobacter gandavensis TaxID=169960 RepID=A0ABN2PEG6_9MICC|nr:hypothetical protein [Arthrobacter citreus]